MGLDFAIPRDSECYSLEGAECLEENVMFKRIAFMFWSLLAVAE